jgi:hypothetical protein
MRRRLGWVWWSVPNMSCYNHLMFSMRRRVSTENNLNLGPLILWCPFFPCNFSKEASMIKEHFIKIHLHFSVGEFVAQFKFTVLLMPNGPMRITSGPFEPDLYKSELEVQDAELKVSVERRVVNMWHLYWE